jgi:hypothetical protein
MCRSDRREVAQRSYLEEDDGSQQVSFVVRGVRYEIPQGRYLQGDKAVVSDRPAFPGITGSLGGRYERVFRTWDGGEARPARSKKRKRSIGTKRR